jgi:hypothetical protein
VPPFASVLSLGWALAAGVLEWTYFVSLAGALERGPLGPVHTVSRGGAIDACSSWASCAAARS